MGFESLWMFDLMGTVFPVFFVMILGIIILSAGREIMGWKRNRNEPVLTVSSRIASRRMYIQQRQLDDASPTATTLYFITFEVESGDRLEFKVNGEQYGMCSEGDSGRLTFQGTRYIGFERDHRAHSIGSGGMMHG
ncbi:DUF2500 domain-containing protein [Paenibacillus sp. P96]|uniref:DUF2500 domain-containing protein n=1 Tax=Paenibacillus zeirhizosphaerae TaxID=2987519 RepID=A0ABT9FVQ9_9BACL|nr:DUF2500 domain-containing protein [Paenibacillus sp. P96]MDP4098705.1 DUF2500 domain-containing protein [Paenibacillus sp. P96]